jgi:hypothetical protein
LRARLSAHPRHLIPARSRLDRPGKIALFIRNIEKEFGSVARVADLADVPGAVADYLAVQNLPTDLGGRAASGARRHSVGGAAAADAAAAAASRRMRCRCSTGSRRSPRRGR